MEFRDEIQKFVKTIPENSKKINAEEGTKHTLVMPFFEILGYNFRDPDEVDPESNADIGLKKGEKVDYAIKKDGKKIILIECKSVKLDLGKEYVNQLDRYFYAAGGKIGILTNGIVYKFFTDIEAENKMDHEPFLEINLNKIDEHQIDLLKKFRKENLNPEEIKIIAKKEKDKRDIIRIINKEFSNPSKDFVKLFISQLKLKGKMTKQKEEYFTPIIKDSLNQILSKKTPEDSSPQSIIVKPSKTKICHKCKRDLPLEDFYKAKSSKDGYAPSCKDCQWGSPLGTRTSKPG